MKWALVNGDYEFELFRDEVGRMSPERIVRNRNDIEFVFFYLNHDKTLGLSSTQKYEESFFDRLSSLGFTVPSVEDHSPADPWYGKLQDIPKEKRLNSKLWSYELLNQLNLNPCENHVVSSREEIISILATRKPKNWFLKSPYFMSGVGFTVIKQE